MINDLAVCRCGTVYNSIFSFNSVGRVVVDAKVDPSAVLVCIAAQKLFVGNVNADDCFGFKALFLNAFIEKAEVLWQTGCDYSCIFAERTKREAQRVGTAQGVAVGIVVGEELKVVVQPQKLGGFFNCQHLLPRSLLCQVR